MTSLPGKTTKQEVMKAVTKEVTDAITKEATKAVTKEVKKTVTKEVTKTVTKEVTKAVTTEVIRESTPARYLKKKRIQSSLFGETVLAFDSFLNKDVVVKISQIQLVKDRASRNGILLLENVRREAQVMTDLIKLSQLPRETICAETHGLSSPPDVMDLKKGFQSINPIIESLETDKYHYLVAEYANGESLMEVINKCPQHRVSEDLARIWFKQICLAMKFLHGHSIVHLDLSLENICMNFPNLPTTDLYTPADLVEGQIKLIDFGLASYHPFSNKHQSDNHLQLLGEVEKSTCVCLNCTGTQRDILAKTYAVEKSGKKPRSPSYQELKFLCRPTCGNVHRIGKLGYMAPEIYHNGAWDAYKADIYSLGVILYTMLTGRPAYTAPIDTDMWFQVIFNGTWLHPSITNQPPASIYTHLSTEALDLIDQMISPQSQRPTIDQILIHPWFQIPNQTSLLKRDRSIPSGRQTKYARRQQTC